MCLISSQSFLLITFVYDFHVTSFTNINYYNYLEFKIHNLPGYAVKVCPTYLQKIKKIDLDSFIFRWKKAIGNIEA